MPLRRAGRLLVVPAAALGLLLSTACTPLGSPATRQTPAIPRVWDASDPAVLVEGEDVYLFGSSNNKKVPVREVGSFNGSLAVSKDRWDEVYSPASQNDAMPTRPAWVNPSKFGGTWQIWAPSVVKIGPSYYLYFAGSRIGANDTHNDQCIGRAVASNPMGPYSPGPDPLYCGLPAEPGSNPWGRGALDPEVFRAPDGRLYLLVSLSRTEDPIGVLPLRSDGRIPGGTNAVPTTLVSKQLPWHDGSDDSSLNRGFGTLENASMIHEPRTNTYLLFYSAGRWDSAYYNTGFARCATPTGPCTKQTDGPFLKSGNGRTGVGGLTAFRTADGQMRVGYATWKAGKEPPNNTPNPDGSLSRQVHWQRISVTATSSASAQSVRLVD